MPPPIQLGATKSAEKYLGQSTVAGLPDPTTVPAGGYYEMTDAGSAYTITWAIGDKAISNGTSYAKKLVPVAKVVDGGTGASNSGDASLPGNLNFYSREAMVEQLFSRQAGIGIEFNGVTGEIEVDDDPILSRGDGVSDYPMTIASVIKPKDLTNFPIAAKNEGGANVEYVFGTVGEKLRMRLRDASGGDSASATEATASMGDNELHHVVATYDGRGGDASADGLELYIDSNQAGVDRDTDAGYVAMEDTSAPMRIGRSVSGGTFASGGIESLLIYNCLLGQSDITNLFNNGNRPARKHRWGGVRGGVYTSDFSSGLDGMTVVGVTATANYDSGDAGFDQTLRLVANDGTSDYAQKDGLFEVGQQYSVEIWVKMVAGSSGRLFAGGVQLEANLSNTAWEKKSYTFVAGSTGPLYIYPANTGQAADEMLVSGIKITKDGVIGAWQSDNIVGNRVVDPTPNKLDGSLVGGVALGVPPGRSIHSPSDLSTDVIELITAGVNKTAILQRLGTGLHRGVQARQVSSGNGYEQIVEVSLAVDATVVVGDLFLGSDKGWADVIQSSGTAQGWAKLVFEGDAADPAILEDRHTLWSVTKDTESKINVYRDAGASNVLTIQNKTAATIQLTIRLLGTQLA